MKETRSLIRNARLSRNMSMRQLAEGLDPRVSIQFISNIEMGKAPVPAKKVVGLCQILGLDPNLVLECMVDDYRAKIEAVIARARQPVPREA